MTKVTWLGEDHLHTQKDGTLGAGPSFTTWKGYKFPKDVSVEVTDTHIIAKAKRNPFFKVEEEEKKRGPGRPPKNPDEPKEPVNDDKDTE